MVEAAASWWLPWWLGGSPFQDSRDATSLQSQGQSRREGQRVQEGPRRSQGWRSHRQEKVASRLFLVDQVFSGAYNKFVVNLHKEQTSKLQAKNQQELDLLDDIRNFMKQKAAIEKHYAEGLLKLSSVYGTKKIATVGGEAKISQMSKRVKCKFVSSSNLFFFD